MEEIVVGLMSDVVGESQSCISLTFVFAILSASLYLRSFLWPSFYNSILSFTLSLIGAKPAEVSAQSTLTQNLHTMLQTFYRPNSPPVKPHSKSASNGIQTNGHQANGHQTNGHGTSSSGGKIRHKIIYETKAFPSDQYALRSAIELAGFDPETSLISLIPRKGELTLRTEDIFKRMEELAEEGETAMIMMSGIQYYTGQWFEMEKITKKGKELVSFVFHTLIWISKDFFLGTIISDSFISSLSFVHSCPPSLVWQGFIVGWDLAHAFANVPLALHDWGVDFAVWCTYKYGSSGPGGIAGLFVHEDWAGGEEGKKLLRWVKSWWHSTSDYLSRLCFLSTDCMRSLFLPRLLRLSISQTCWMVGSQQVDSIRNARRVRSNSRSCRIPTIESIDSRHAGLERFSRDSLQSQGSLFFFHFQVQSIFSRMRNHRTNPTFEILQVDMLSRAFITISRILTFRSRSQSSHTFRHLSKRISIIHSDSKRQVKQSASNACQDGCSTWW